MTVARFKEECPGISATIERILGREAANEIASDYAVVADAGGNFEKGVVRDKGVSFNPRAGRILSIMISDGDIRDTRAFRVAMYATLFPHTTSSRIIPDELASDVQAVSNANDSHPEWIAVIALSLILDTVRHHHMTDMGNPERKAFFDSVESHPLLSREHNVARKLRNKVLHALKLQQRHLAGGVCR
jgi:hypothetical protein